MVDHIPERGDVVRIELNPQAGHEQTGKRPAIVLSPKAYNGKVGLALFCPITSHIKGYPFEVRIPHGYVVSGVILSDQIKSLDRKARKANFVCKFDQSITQEVLKKTGILLKNKRLFALVLKKLPCDEILVGIQQQGDRKCRKI